MKTDWTCIEFTRTVGWEERDREDDELKGYDALVDWAKRRGLLEAADAQALRRRAAAHPRVAARVLRRAIELRALVYRILSAIGVGETPASADLKRLNELLPEAQHRLGIVRTAEGYAWDWLLEGELPLSCVLWPILRSAAELLTSDVLDRVKLCDADDCGWLFIDASRNRSRRWCDMSDCGNRAKVRRFRERRR
jgi:predicted RNA-binding Zn ribbon-like protein